MATAFPINGIVIDRSIAANLHRQLYSELRGLIERRVLPSGTALPSTRLLTKDLGVGRNTVIAAYEQLALEGYLLMRRGSPPLVMDLPTTITATKNPRTEIGSTISARGKIMLANPITMAVQVFMHFIPACRIPTISPSRPGRSCSASGQSWRATIFSAPITSVAIHPCAKPSPATSPRRAG